MLNDLRTSVIVDLKGNLERMSRRYTRSMDRMSRRGNHSLSRLNAGWKKHSGVLKTAANRYTTIIGLGTAAAAAKNTIDRDARLTQLQTDGRATEEQIAQLKSKLLEIANDPAIRLDPDIILSGFQAIIDKTGDFDFAMENMRNLALTIRATNAAGKDVGAVFSNFYKAGIRDAEKLLALTDKIVQQTYQGSVAFRDIATVGNKLIAPAVAGVGASEQTVIDTGAVAQIIIDAVGSPDEAAEAYKALLSFLNKKDVQKKLRGAGVEVTKDDGKLRSPRELIPEIFDVTKGDMGVLGKLFGESAVKVFQGFSLEGNREKLQSLSVIDADGTTLKENARINASTPKAALRSLATRTEIAADSIISEPAKDAAKALDNFESSDASTNAVGVGYALGASVVEIDRWIGQQMIDSGRTILDLNQQAGQSIYDGVMSMVDRFNETPKAPASTATAAQPEKFSGELSIKIDSEGRPSVTSLKSNHRGIDMDVDTGAVMVGN